jgi:hypothetical protein
MNDMRIGKVIVMCWLVAVAGGASVRAAQATAPATSATQAAEAEQPLKPGLQFPTLEAYERAIGEAGVVLQGKHLWLFAPKSKSKEAGVIFKTLSAAYEELYRIVGVHTTYKMIVYHLPRGWGGTSEFVIEYDYSNLDFEKSEEWRKHKVPHVSGYIEEMAHNFVRTTRAQFGWEMIGWSIGVKTTQRVAPNPIFARSVQATRAEQAKTLARYKQLGNVFPPDLEGNLCDRIHAQVLWQCEQRYGANFWPDCFREINKQKKALDDAVNMKGDDNIRNERCRITVDCFDRLPGLKFKQLLQQYGISPTVDIKSLHPTDPKWDRRLEPVAGGG